MIVPGMELYIKFMGTLALGILGVGLVLKILLETLFNEWDAINDLHDRFQAWISGKHQVELLRPEDILLEAEKRGEPRNSSRLVDIRREQLRQLDEVDARLAKARQLAPVTR